MSFVKINAFQKGGAEEQQKYTVWNFFFFFYLKPHKHMALHQIHKIMLFLATSYDPFNLLLWYCICVLSADMMGTHCSAALNVTTLWLTAGRWWLQWQHNAVTQEFVCSEKNEKRFDSDIEALFISGRWNLRSLLSGASDPIAGLFMTLLWQFKFCCHLRSQS